MARGNSSLTAKIGLACYLLLPAALYAVPLESVTQGGHTLCLFHNLFDRACYGCGMTRALFSLLHLDFGAAWGYHRLVFVVAPLLGYLWLRGTLRAWRRVRALRRAAAQSEPRS